MNKITFLFLLSLSQKTLSMNQTLLDKALGEITKSQNAKYKELEEKINKRERQDINQIVQTILNTNKEKPKLSGMHPNYFLIPFDQNNQSHQIIKAACNISLVTKTEEITNGLYKIFAGQSANNSILGIYIHKSLVKKE